MAEKGEGGETQDVDFPFGMAAVAPLVSESLKRGFQRDCSLVGWSRRVGLGQSKDAGELVAELIPA
jgi:hypothetical protein